MNETPIVRIQRASIKNFRNVESGDIRFPCNYGEDIFAPKADVLGIYGQNGSGKTTFIDALEILKRCCPGKRSAQNCQTAFPTDKRKQNCNLSSVSSNCMRAMLCTDGGLSMPLP